MRMADGIAIQRTVVLTLGEAGRTVGQRLLQMLDEWESPPVVAVQYLDNEQENAELIAAALHEVSRLSHRITLQRLGYSAARLSELAIWVVGGSEESLIKVARLANGQASTLLGSDPITMGLVLGTYEDQPLTRSLLPPIVLDKQVSSAFTGPCYVATLVNEFGLKLDDASALHERVARFLALHICTPLRDAPTWIERSHGWQEGLGYASFGVTWMAWPGAVAQERAKRRLAQTLMPQLIGPLNASPDIDALLRGAKLAIPQLVPRLTPPIAHDLARSFVDEPLTPNLWNLLQPPNEEEHPLLTHMTDPIEEREEKLDGCTSSWERLMQDQIEGIIAATHSWVAEALDREGFARAWLLIEVLEERLGDWASGAEQRSLELRDEMLQMEGQARDLLEKMTSLLAQMPECRLRDLLKLLRRPSRWVRVWLHWRKIRRLHGQYCLLRAAALETRVTVEQMERACGVYWAAISELQSISRGLDRAELQLSDLFDLEGEAADWPTMPLLLGEEPDELLEDLMERYAPPPQSVGSEFLTEFGPLSELWTGEVPSQTMTDEWLTRQVASLAEISVWDVARCLHPRPDDLQAWIEELLAQATPLWRWDPTALSDGERDAVDVVTVVLSTPAGLPWDDDEVAWQSVPLRRGDCLGVITLRWGIPAASD